MAKEIERKFLLKDSGWRGLAAGTLYRQGYLSTAIERVVRVRTIGERGYLTIKSLSVGITRTEFEYEIPIDDANVMLDHLCERPLIEKTRYAIPHGGFTWEVDEFHGENAGLILAEVELEDESQELSLPPWIGEEVSEDPRYFNANLVKHPYITW